MGSGRDVRCVRTGACIPTGAAQVWDALLYYEQIVRPPPALLRWLLPMPRRTLGEKARVGDEAVCEYDRGHLRKRVTAVEPGHCYRFTVVEQTLPLPGLVLLDGAYVLNPIAEHATTLTLETRYLSHRRPSWLWRPIETAVCHAFHRHLLVAMGAQAETATPARKTAAGPDGNAPRQNQTADLGP